MGCPNSSLAVIQVKANTLSAPKYSYPPHTLPEVLSFGHSSWFYFVKCAHISKCNCKSSAFMNSLKQI
jgi:hypothetical protein